MTFPLKYNNFVPIVLIDVVYYLFDYLRLISSGTMIIATDDGEKLAEKLQAAGIEAAVIGKLTEGGKYMLVNGMRLPLEQPGSDALYEAKL